MEEKQEKEILTISKKKTVIGETLTSGGSRKLFKELSPKGREYIASVVESGVKDALGERATALQHGVQQITSDTQKQEHAQQAAILESNPTRNVSFENQYISSVVATKKLVLKPINESQFENLLTLLADKFNKLIEYGSEQNKYSRYLKKLYESKLTHVREEGLSKKKVSSYLKSRTPGSGYFNIPPYSENWVERHVHLETFKKYVNEKKIFSIAGIAGSGKTQLAHRFGYMVQTAFQEENNSKILIREFSLDQENGLEKGYRDFLKILDLDFIEDEDIAQLDHEQLFQEIKDGLDIEYKDSSILFIYDNVDRQSDIEYLNKLLKNDPWFASRGCYIIITSQKENFFNASRLGVEINLNAGLTLAESLILLKQESIREHLINEGANLGQFCNVIRKSARPHNRGKDEETFLDMLGISAEDDGLESNDGVNIKKQAISFLSLIEIFDGLPLGLAIAQKYLEVMGNNVNRFIQLVTDKNQQTLEYIDQLSDYAIQDSYRKNRGACSQLSAILLMIKAADEDKNFKFTGNSGALRISDVIQILSLYSFNKIPEVIIHKILKVNLASGFAVFPDKFIYILKSRSLIQESELKTLYQDDGELSEINILTLHSQTHFAARILLSQNKDKQFLAEQALAVITAFSNEYYLNDKRNFEVKTLIGSHFFHLIDYIASNPQNNLNIDSILNKYVSQIKYYIETNYSVIWPRKLLTMNGIEASPSLKMKIYENLVNCYAEIGNQQLVNEYGEKAVQAFKNTTKSTKKDADILLSVCRVYLHLRNYGEAKKILNLFVFNRKETINETQARLRTVLLMDIDACENGQTDIRYQPLNLQNNIDLDVMINYFRVGSLLLKNSNYQAAIEIFNGILAYKAKIPHTSLVSDIQIACYVAYIMNGDYSEVVGSQSKMGDDQIQIGYLVCIAHIARLIQEKQLGQSDRKTLVANSRRWLDFIFKSCKIFPTEIFLLRACIEHFNENHKAALVDFEKYFSFLNRKYINPLEKYNSIWSKRVFYFLPHSLLLLTGNNLALIIQPYYRYYCCLKESNQLSAACEALINHINHENSDSSRLNTHFDALRDLAQDMGLSYVSYTRLTDTINNNKKTAAFFQKRGRFGLKNYNSDVKERILADFKQSEDLVQKGNKIFIYLSISELYIKDLDFEEAYIWANKTLEAAKINSQFYSDDFKNSHAQIYLLCARGINQNDKKKSDIILNCYDYYFSYCKNDGQVLYQAAQYAEKFNFFTKSKQYYAKAFAIYKDSKDPQLQSCYRGLIEMITCCAEKEKEKNNIDIAIILMEKRLKYETSQDLLELNTIYFLLDLYTQKKNINHKERYKELIDFVISLQDNLTSDSQQKKTVSEKYYSYAQILSHFSLADEAIDIAKRASNYHQTAHLLILVAQLLCKKSTVNSYFEAYQLLKNTKISFLLPQEKVTIGKIYCEIADGLSSQGGGSSYTEEINQSYRIAIEYAPTEKGIQVHYNKYLHMIGDKKELVRITREQRVQNYSYYCGYSQEDTNKLFLELISLGETTDDFDERIQIYQEAAALYNSTPNNEANKLLARDYYKNNDLTKSIELLDKIINYQTNDEDVYLLGVLCYTKLGQYDNAQNYFEDMHFQHQPTFKYFGALCLLKKSQYYAVDSKEKMKSISIAKGMLESAVLTGNYSNLLEPCSQEYRDFYCLYARFLAIYRQAEVAITSCKTVPDQKENFKKEIKNITSDLDALYKQDTFFKNNLTNYSMHQKLNKQLKLLKKCIDKNSLEEMTLYQANQLEMTINLAVKNYDESTRLLSMPNPLTKRFKTCWSLFVLNYEEDLFLEDRYLKCRLLLKWYFDNTDEGRLRTCLNALLSPDFIRSLNELELNRYETDLDIATKKYALSVGWGSEESAEFMDGYFKIKFTCHELKKDLQYKKLLSDFFNKKQDKCSNLKSCIKEHFPRQDEDGFILISNEESIGEADIKL